MRKDAAKRGVYGQARPAAGANQFHRRTLVLAHHSLKIRGRENKGASVKRGTTLSAEAQPAGGACIPYSTLSVRHHPHPGSSYARKANDVNSDFTILRNFPSVVLVPAAAESTFAASSSQVGALAL